MKNYKNCDIMSVMAKNRNQNKDKNPDTLVGILDFSPNQRFGKNRDKIFKNFKLLAGFLIISFILANFFINFSTPLFAQSEDVQNLNQKIDQRKKEISDLQKQIDAYSQKIKDKQSEAKTMKNQIAILDNQIAKINLDIEATQARIDQTNLEIQAINLQIQNLEKDIAGHKEKIAEYIRLIYEKNQKSYLEIMLTNDNFSDFFDQLKYTQQINNNLKSSLDKVKNDKQNLQVQKTTWEEKADLEEKLKNDLQQKKAELTEKSSAQEYLLIQTKQTERQYQSQAYQLQLEQQQINSDIISLEKQVRQKLETLKKEEKFNVLGPAKFNWPVSPDRGISAYFHDPDYPFRYIFEHPAVDIRASQSTPIKAPEAGYVARVKFRGDKSYAYVMLIHNDGFSTVYGHVSKVLVKEDDFVTKGQTIALSGGLPGTPGSGPLTTGPHLHFEVRLNGIPVNPLEYLP